MLNKRPGWRKCQAQLQGLPLLSKQYLVARPTFQELSISRGRIRHHGGVNRLRFAVLVLFAGCRAPADPAEASPRCAPVVLDERRLDFTEDEGSGRVVADVRAFLLLEDGRVRLRISASAVGPRVDPVPGFQGIRGANRIAAEELQSILRKERGMLATRRGTGVETERGREARRGRIPERRLNPDGTLDLDAESREEFPLEAVFETAPPGDGVYTTELVVDGRPRLRVVYRVKDNSGRISALEAVDGHGNRP
ncbi:MAG: hypothetical protein FD180_1688 [Planctomycetota bacterium]|nr:MAG: hypothetical protein FD180_1688 [Planctomycetota bacterium]